MHSRRIWRWSLLILTIGAGLAVTLRAEEAPTASSRASRPSAESSATSSSRPSALGSSAKELEAKLNDILENQQKVLKRLDEVMAELQIVKIRATVR